MSRKLKVLALASLCSVLLAVSAHAAAPAVDWEKVYGDTALQEAALWMEEHSYHGYVVAGHIDDMVGGPEPGFLMRLNESGDTLWMKTYGDTADISILCCRETSDGGYILAGMIEPTLGDFNAYLIRTDSSGDTLWTSSFGSTDDEIFYSVLETSDMGFMCVGFTSENVPGGETDFLILKTDADGEGQWNEIYGGPGVDRAAEIVRTSDGNYVLTGYKDIAGDRDAIILKFDGTSGDSLWAKTYGDTMMDIGSAIRETYDGGLIVGGGIIEESGLWTKAWLIRTDANGDSIWTKEYGGTGDNQYITSLAETPDLGYICAGRRDTSSTGAQNAYFLKTDSSGDSLWTKMTGDDGRQSLSCMVPTRDGGYAATGYSRVLVPEVGRWDIYIVKLGIDQAGVVPGDDAVPSADAGAYTDGALFIDGRNPFSGRVPIRYELASPAHVRLSVYDVGGRLVTTLTDEVHAKGTHHAEWDCSGIYGHRATSGVYFIQLYSEGIHSTRKVLILR